MRSFGHERDPFRLHPVGDLADDGPDRAAADQGQRPEEMGGTLRHLGVECLFGQGGKALRLGAAFHPDHGGTGPAVMIGQRHEGKGPARAVDLGRDILMRDRVGHGKGQRLLPVAQRGGGDARGLPHRAGPAIGADHEFRRNPGAVAQAHARFGLAGHQLCRAFAGAEIHIGQLCQMRRDLAPQEPIGQVPAKGQLRDVGGVEIMGHARFRDLAARIHDPHHLQRHGMGGKTVPEPGPVEELARGLKKGRGAQVGAFGRCFGHGGGRVCADDGKSRLPESCGGDQAGDAAARDEDVGVFDLDHGPELGRSGAHDDATGCPKAIFRTKNRRLKKFVRIF